MEFLEKLYSQEYFAPVLFTIIAILAVLFIIVLILALRDAKKKKSVQGGTNDAFAQVSETPQEINVNVSAPVAPVEAPVETPQEEVKEENVISSVEPTPTGFESVEVPAPVVENNETPIVSETPASVETPVQDEPQDIKIDNIPEVSTSDVEKAENDLDSIAASLLSDYQKENEKKEEPSIQPNEFSAVGITPNTLPVEEEKTEMPGLSDIPVPQPVRVTDTSTVIDSSKQGVDNIPTEEYNINK